MAIRYFQTIGTRKGRFAADTGERTRKGQPFWVKLVYATETKIRRHVKIRAEANPFDPDWHGYFDERAFFKKFGIHRHEAGTKTVVKTGSAHAWLCNGLSRMKGNFHVRFMTRRMARAHSLPDSVEVLLRQRAHGLVGRF